MKEELAVSIQAVCNLAANHPGFLGFFSCSVGLVVGCPKLTHEKLSRVDSQRISELHREAARPQNRERRLGVRSGVAFLLMSWYAFLRGLKEEPRGNPPFWGSNLKKNHGHLFGLALKGQFAARPARNILRAQTVWANFMLKGDLKQYEGRKKNPSTIPQKDARLALKTASPGHLFSASRFLCVSKWKPQDGFTGSDVFPVFSLKALLAWMQVFGSPLRYSLPE